jgi:hypothetical protein
MGKKALEEFKSELEGATATRSIKAAALDHPCSFLLSLSPEAREIRERQEAWWHALALAPVLKRISKFSAAQSRGKSRSVIPSEANISFKVSP